MILAALLLAVPNAQAAAETAGEPDAIGDTDPFPDYGPGLPGGPLVGAAGPEWLLLDEFDYLPAARFGTHRGVPVVGVRFDFVLENTGAPPRDGSPFEGGGNFLAVLLGIEVQAGSILVLNLFDVGIDSSVMFGDASFYVRFEAGVRGVAMHQIWTNVEGTFGVAPFAIGFGGRIENDIWLEVAALAFQYFNNDSEDVNVFWQENFRITGDTYYGVSLTINVGYERLQIQLGGPFFLSAFYQWPIR